MPNTEALVHIELADLAATGVYLQPAWPSVGAPDQSVQIDRRASTQCKGCGQKHQEIFEFKEWPEGGPYSGMEWERVVKPVIQHWAAFVDIYVHAV